MIPKRLILLPAAILAGLLLTTAFGQAQSILNSAGNFTLFGGTAITSSGTVGTVIQNGNVGLSPGPDIAITGFPPAVIQNGAVIPTSPATAQARLDLIQAQAGLAGLPSNTNLSNMDLGGQILAPGVYTFDASANLTGALILDAQGRNNVFWVFQIGTSLTAAVNSSVTIINPGSNGGSDYGVFWNVGSAVNIGANNQIVGNYLAGTSITFGVNSAGGGRALALAGVLLDNNQINAFGGPGGSDFAGGLMFDGGGVVVPIPDPVVIVAPQDPPLAFFHFGKNHRTTLSGSRVVRGNATVGATAIQSSVNAKAWRSNGVQPNQRWTVTARVQPGKNHLRLRAINAKGEVTAIQRMTIWRH